MSGVTVTLGGKEETLRPTLRAARIVNGMGSFTGAYERVRAGDLEAYIIVVAAGLNKKPDEVAQAVYEAGVIDLGQGVAEFVNLLANGGKAAAPVVEDAPAGEA